MSFTAVLCAPLDASLLQIYAESQPFEIKPQGSAYPDPSATPTETVSSPTSSGSGASQTGGNSGAATTSTPSNNAATGVHGSLASVVVVAAGVLGLMFA